MSGRVQESESDGLLWDVAWALGIYVGRMMEGEYMSTVCRETYLVAEVREVYVPTVC